jgi:hypothetical protein
MSNTHSATAKEILEQISNANLPTLNSSLLPEASLANLNVINRASSSTSNGNGSPIATEPAPEEDNQSIEVISINEIDEGDFSLDASEFDEDDYDFSLDASEFDDNEDDDDDSLEASESELNYFEDSKRIQKTFEHRVGDLRIYKIMHGHCNPSRKKNKTLNLWLRRVRKNYKLFIAGKKCHILTEERVNVLEELGVEFGSRFERRVEDLSIYKEKYGHCNVVRKNNVSLSEWLYTIRKDYKLFIAGKKCHILTEERVNVLEELGVEFGSRHIKFERRVEDLSIYKEKYGHCNVTNSDNVSLYKWLYKVRKNYKLFIAGKKCHILTEERVNVLEELGVEFGPFEKLQAM